MEAVQTNIIGTRNVIEACKYNKIKKAIFLSTDKSVYPVNAMGMTKALMEKVVLSYAKDKNANFCITRYGNVMGSRGSVIPLFINQIKRSKTNNYKFENEQILNVINRYSKLSLPSVNEW